MNAPTARYFGSAATESGQVLTLDELVRGMPRHRATRWLEQFWARVDKSPGEDACWIWRGARTTANYGLLMVNRMAIRAHRLSFLLEHGAIPRDRYCCHRCDNPACVRPSHLFLGSAADNARDMVSKSRNARRKLTADRVQELRVRHAAGESLRSLADGLGVVQGTVWKALVGRTWKHVPGLEAAA
jgi:hypothetical protein